MPFSGRGAAALYQMYQYIYKSEDEEALVW